MDGWNFSCERLEWKIEKKPHCMFPRAFYVVEGGFWLPSQEMFDRGGGVNWGGGREGEWGFLCDTQKKKTHPDGTEKKSGAFSPAASPFLYIR